MMKRLAKTSRLTLWWSTDQDRLERSTNLANCPDRLADRCVGDRFSRLDASRGQIPRPIVLALLDEEKPVAMSDDDRREVPGGDRLACQEVSVKGQSLGVAPPTTDEPRHDARHVK